jgi:hypothetical protein
MNVVGSSLEVDLGEAEWAAIQTLQFVDSDEVEC